MPLLIEDGTGVADANSYITVAELRTFCNDRGVTFPPVTTGDNDAANVAIYTPYLIRACDYLENLRNQFAGIPTYSGSQYLSWPRSYVRIDFVFLSNTVIPGQLKKAQAQLCVEQMQGISLQPSIASVGTGSIPDGPNGPVKGADGRFVKRKKVDVLETEWSETIATYESPSMPAVEAFLRSLLTSGGQFFTSVRV